MNKLSERQLEIMELLCEGLSNAEIAQKLIISKTTVATHVQGIFNRLGVCNRAAAVAKYLRGQDDG